MARFHVYNMRVGYALDVQSDLHNGLNSRVMIPLVEAGRVVHVMSKLNPIVVVNGGNYLLAVERMAAVPAIQIGSFAADMTSRSDDITAALDFLFQGF